MSNRVKREDQGTATHFDAGNRGEFTGHVYGLLLKLGHLSRSPGDAGWPRCGRIQLVPSPGRQRYEEATRAGMTT